VYTSKKGENDKKYISSELKKQMVMRIEEEAFLTQK
jgi:hypothetical protein